MPLAPPDGPGKLAEHPLRRLILELLEQDPGLSFTMLLGRIRSVPGHASVGSGTLTHHLYRLERSGRLTSRRSGRLRRLYVGGGPLGDPTVLSLLQHPGLSRLLGALLVRQAPSQTDLWRALQADMPLSRQCVSHRLGHLEACGLVVARRAGRLLQYYPTPRLLRSLETLRRWHPLRRWAPPVAHDPSHPEPRADAPVAITVPGFA
jgi:DNA-binding transcriptional ArsR family regulator